MPLRLIGKWLSAGVMRDGAIEYPESAAAGRGDFSNPGEHLSHEVLDAWFVQQVAPRLRGHAVLVRYADDAVIIFKSELDAVRVASVAERDCQVRSGVPPKEASASRLIRKVPQ